MILEAARTAFAEQGYARTTTRQVAKLAGVAPSQLFAHFGTKTALFEHAAIAPYADLLSGFVARWESLPHKDIPTRELCRDLVEDLFDLFTPWPTS